MEEKKRKQDLGIFYTPPEVIEFIFSILNIWKGKQKSRWRGKNPSVIDPAVGEGGFLKYAISSKFTKPEWIFGLDIDENAVKKWKEINLLKEFGGNENDLEAHFFHQDGLEKIKWEEHLGKYRYKLKQDDIRNQQFDAVVGNPPYGGLGVSTLKDKTTEESIRILEHFKNFKIINYKKEKKPVENQTTLWGDASWDEAPQGSGGTPNIDEIESTAIEILFLDRFIQLAKPGGWIAIIIPDGILSNSNLEYVRKYIYTQTKVRAIISLPRETFKVAGTNAKTSILFLDKLKNNEKSTLEYPVFLASLEKINIDNFEEIVNSYKKFYNKNKL